VTDPREAPHGGWPMITTIGSMLRMSIGRKTIGQMKTSGSIG